MSMIQQELRSLRIIHRALCTGSVVFLAVVLYVISTLGGGQMATTDDDAEFMGHLFAGIAAGMLIVQALISSQIFKKGLQQIAPQWEMIAKLQHYRKLLIQSWALMESVQFFAIVTFLLTAHPALVVIWGAAFWMMITNAPSKQRLVQNLDLTPEEEKTLEN